LTPTVTLTPTRLSSAWGAVLQARWQPTAKRHLARLGGTAVDVYCVVCL
jgi:hypothetical protein